MEEPQNLTPHRGGVVLALGIVSIVACQLLGVAPWVMGKADLVEMDEGRMDPSGRGLTEAGKILGLISLAFCAFGILFVIAMGVFSLGTAALSGQ